MPTQNVSLTAAQAQFIKRCVSTGRYQNASEVVRAGLRLLAAEEKEKQLKLRTLRRMLEEGEADIDAGRYEIITPDNLKDFMQSVSATNRNRESK